MSLDPAFSEIPEVPAERWRPDADAVSNPRPKPVARTVFSDEAVAIRPFRPEDVLSHYRAVRESINELAAWMVWGHPDYSLKDSVAFIRDCESGWQQGSQYCFVIEDKQTREFLGTVGLNQVNHMHHFANLGYWVRSSCTGRNIAPAAVRLAARFGLHELGLHRLELLVPVGNRFSQRVAEKAGAHREGVLRNRLVLQKTRHDAILYSLIPSDLKAG